MKKIAPWLLILAGGIVFFLFFRSRPPKHIFLITLDTTRADAVDYTPGNPRTPNLAALAAAGERWENAYSVIPITLPSHAAMFYSLPPHVFKVYNNGQKRDIPFPTLAELMKRKGYATGAVVSLAVLGRDFGLDRGFDFYREDFRPGLWYKTAAEVNRDAFSLIDRLKGDRSFVWLHYSDPHEPYFPPGPTERFVVSLNGKPIVSESSIEQPVLRIPIVLERGSNTIGLETELPRGLSEGRGFDGIGYSDLRIRPADAGVEFDAACSPDMVLRNERYGLAAFTTRSTRSTLTVVNRGESPCRAELTFKYQIKLDDEAKRAGYEREIRYLDSQIGLLLERLKREGIYKESVFLVMGDHGEGLGEYRSHFGHIHYLNKVYVHVPFFVSGRGVRRRTVRSGLASNFNVAPLLLSLAGIKKPTHMIGGDLLETGREENQLFLETYSPEAYFDAFAVIRFPWQIIFYPGRSDDRFEFFNLETDRFGAVNLAAGGDSSGRRSEMTNSVLKLSRIITANKRNRESLNRKTMDTLKSLGYL